MTVLVTGGSGFLGRHLLPLLTEQHEVLATARSSAAADRVAVLGASPIYADLDDPESVDEAFAASKADVLVNVASLGFGHAPAIVASAEEAGIARAVFVSTTSIFTSLNTSSKQVRVAAERTVMESELDWTIVRPTMIYGDRGDRNMERLLALLRRSPVVPLPGGGNRLQQPVQVDDLAAAIAAIVERPAAVGKSYAIAGPEAITFRTLISQAASAVGRSPTPVPIPLRPTVAAVRLYERVANSPRIRAEQLERLAEDKAFDITAARDDLEFDPRSFAVGIEEEARRL